MRKGFLLELIVTIAASRCGAIDLVSSDEGVANCSGKIEDGLDISFSPDPGHQADWCRYA